MEKVIECVNVEKKYFLFEKDYKVIPWLFTKRGCKEEKVILKDINLTVNKGDVIAFIGKNGAGKSTLMKIIAGIVMQTAGSVQVNGKVNSLINLGAGFHQKYTGRQNIYYKGLLMGLSNRSIDDMIDDIADFCELGDYFDLPLYMYSSGMRARLGFALAIFAEHDILIVDEVFAVGDKSFRDKSAKKMTELFKSGKSIIFASHDENQLKKFCNRAIYIDDCEIVVDGTVEQALRAYNNKYSQNTQQNAITGKIKSMSADKFVAKIRKQKLTKAALYREIALFFEGEDHLELAYKYMMCAKHLSPANEYIINQFERYKRELGESKVRSVKFRKRDLKNIDTFFEKINTDQENFNIADLYYEMASFCELENELNLSLDFIKNAQKFRPNDSNIKDKLVNIEKSLSKEQYN